MPKGKGYGKARSKFIPKENKIKKARYITDKGKSRKIKPLKRKKKGR